MSHLLMENRHCVVVNTKTTHATGTTECVAAEAMIGAVAGQGRITLGSDKAFDTAEHVANLRQMNVTPHVAQNTANRRSAIDRRTTRHAGYAASQRIRERIEEAFGWIKTTGGLRKSRHRGIDRVGWMFTLTRRLPSRPPAQTARGCRVMDTSKHPMLGKWRITSMELWEADFIDLLGPGYIQFDDKGGGAFTFGAIQGGLDCHYGPASIHFTWEGSDEMDHACGDGDAQIEDDGTLTGDIRFHLGDESSFTARRW